MWNSCTMYSYSVEKDHATPCYKMTYMQAQHTLAQHSSLGCAGLRTNSHTNKCISVHCALLSTAFADHCLTAICVKRSPNILGLKQRASPVCWLNSIHQTEPEESRVRLQLELILERSVFFLTAVSSDLAARKSRTLAWRCLSSSL